MVSAAKVQVVRLQSCLIYQEFVCQVTLAAGTLATLPVHEERSKPLTSPQIPRFFGLGKMTTVQNRVSFLTTPG